MRFGVLGNRICEYRYGCFLNRKQDSLVWLSIWAIIMCEAARQEGRSMKHRKDREKQILPAMAFVILMGIVSMFSDMTHEGARSIYGSFLALLGASGAAVGFVTGLGEMVGYSLRLITGCLVDRSKKYWTMTFVGYAINLLAIPLLALVPKNGWILACILIVAERIGKAIRQPSKNTLVSFAAKQIGEGKTFAIQEFLDQIGAFLGPVLLFVVLYVKQGSEYSGYILCFLLLGIPALITLSLLVVASKTFPHPEHFSLSEESQEPQKYRRNFVWFMIAIGFLAMGFVDFPLITLHIARSTFVRTVYLPLIYALAMLVDAFAALIFGWLYDRLGMKVLLLSSAISAGFSFLIFGMNSIGATIVGVILWGVGMGAQETVLKSAITTMVSVNSRGKAFGLFAAVFGISWFAGSWIMGLLYDESPVYLVCFSVAAQLLAVCLFFVASRTRKGAIR